MKNNLLYILIFFPVYCFCDLYIDPTQVIYQRTKKYPKSTYKKIMQVSPMRTGSTLVYNVLRMLFEEEEFFEVSAFKSTQHEVCKWHCFSNDILRSDYIYFITKRNPLDTIYSRCRLSKSTPGEERIRKLCSQYLHFYKRVEELRNKLNIVVLEYEKFSNDIDKIFKAVEDTFSFDIDPQDQSLLKEAFSKENLLIYSNNFQKFNYYDESVLIHGNHINDDSIDMELKDRIRRILKEYKNEVNKLGYKI